MNFFKKLKIKLFEIEFEDAKEIVGQYFEIDNFYKELGIMNGLNRKVGETKDCLTINEILEFKYRIKKDPAKLKHISECERCSKYFGEINDSGKTAEKKSTNITKLENESVEGQWNYN